MDEVGDALLAAVARGVLAAVEDPREGVGLAPEGRVEEVSVRAPPAHIERLGHFAIRKEASGLALVEVLGEVGVLARVEQNDFVGKFEEVQEKGFPVELRLILLGNHFSKKVFLSTKPCGPLSTLDVRVGFAIALDGRSETLRPVQGRKKATVAFFANEGLALELCVNGSGRKKIVDAPTFVVGVVGVHGALRNRLQNQRVNIFGRDHWNRIRGRATN